jgi:hypothetical protein
VACFRPDALSVTGDWSMVTNVAGDLFVVVSLIAQIAAMVPLLGFEVV